MSQYVSLRVRRKWPSSETALPAVGAAPLTNLVWCDIASLHWSLRRPPGRGTLTRHVPGRLPLPGRWRTPPRPAPPRPARPAAHFCRSPGADGRVREWRSERTVWR